MADVQIGAELQALPLDFLVSAPLTAAVKAQRIAALTTVDFIESLIKDDGTPETVDFKVENTVGDQAVTAEIKAPLLSIVPVPHLRIDSLTTHFTFEISQTVTDTKTSEKAAEIAAKTGGFLSPWVSASLKGSMSSKSSKESVMNRSGQLEVTVQASESPMPEGLARVLSMLSKAVELPAAGGQNDND